MFKILHRIKVSLILRLIFIKPDKVILKIIKEITELRWARDSKEECGV